MLWVLKRTVSIEHSKHMFQLIGEKLYTLLCSKPMIHEYSNYANKVICISDHEMKACV